MPHLAMDCLGVERVVRVTDPATRSRENRRPRRMEGVFCRGIRCCNCHRQRICELLENNTSRAGQLAIRAFLSRRRPSQNQLYSVWAIKFYSALGGACLHVNHDAILQLWELFW